MDEKGGHRKTNRMLRWFHSGNNGFTKASFRFPSDPICPSFCFVVGSSRRLGTSFFFFCPLRFERDWPVSVTVEEGRITTFLDDLLITSSWYLERSLFLIAAVLTFRNLCSVVYVPSESMIPTLHRGDAVLVQYITPKLHPTRCRQGDVIFFRPPAALQLYVTKVANGTLSSRDLFVKRIAACPGDQVQVFPDGSVAVNGEK